MTTAGVSVAESLLQPTRAAVAAANRSSAGVGNLILSVRIASVEELNKLKKGRQSAEVAEETRRRILDVAGRQFAAKGFGSTSLRDIAEAAGTTHGLIRHHFGTKEDLWRLVVDDFLAKMLARHMPLLARTEDDDPVTLLKAFATNYIRLSAEMPEVSQLLVKDCTTPGPRMDYLLSRILPIHQAITPVFERARAAGPLRVHDPDSFFIFLVMLGSMPFAVADFTNAFSREDIRTARGIDAHIERVMATLFGEA
jgi:AcrR family transcriptional regulator